MEDPYEDSVIIVDPDSSTTTVQDPDYIAPPPKTKVLCMKEITLLQTTRSILYNGHRQISLVVAGR